MRPSLLLTVAGVCLALVGLGFLLVPDAMTFGALAAGAPAGVVFALRGYGGALLGVAVLDYMARNSDASRARDAIFLANTVVFGLAAITELLGALAGAPAMTWGSVIIDAVFAVAFFVVGRANMSTRPS